MSTLNPDAAKHADIHVAHKGHVDHDAHPHVGKAIQAIHVGLTARKLVDVSLEAARQGLFLNPNLPAQNSPIYGEYQSCRK